MQIERPNESNRRFNHHYRLYGLLAVGFCLALLLFAQPFAAFSDSTLFAPVPDSSSLALDGEEGARRGRVVHVNWNALDQGTEEIVLNLFEDVRLTAQRQRVEPSVTGGFTWVGRLDGDPAGRVTLAVQDGVLSGSVYRYGRAWAVIRYAGVAAGDLYQVLELDPNVPEPSGKDYLIPQPSPAEMLALSPQGQTCVEDGSIIDVMILYTPEARDAAGGQAAIEALINQRVSEMNTANAPSQVAFQWRLAHAMLIDYNESGSIETDLKALQNPTDGVLDGVHAAREAYHADLVAMLVSEGTNGVCGSAYIMQKLDPWFQGYAFGVTALDYAEPYSCSSMTLAHELGHNLGSSHDRANSTGVSLFPYAYGYQSPNKTFRDIMAYDCPGGCPRINQWANPDVWHTGEPTGVDFEINPANAADVARTFNEVKGIVANFRANCSNLPPTPTQTPGGPTPTHTALPTADPTLSALTEKLFMPAVIHK
jgi:hypothetical protein